MKQSWKSNEILFSWRYRNPAYLFVISDLIRGLSSHIKYSSIWFYLVSNYKTVSLLIIFYPCLQLYGKKQHIRALLVERVYLQHQLRQGKFSTLDYSELDRIVLKDLLQLSISRYSEVRYHQRYKQSVVHSRYGVVQKSQWNNPKDVASRLRNTEANIQSCSERTNVKVDIR